MRRALATLLTIGLAACESTEPEPPPDRPTGPRLEVRLLDGGFVEFEGERVAFEEFAYELRLRCRAASNSSMPWLLVESPREPRPGIPELVEGIRREAWDAGIQHVEFALEDS